MADYIGYEALSQAAMRGVVREVLKKANEPNGLPGEHHFYITFRTKAPNVKLAQYLIDRFPEEMTVVVQHQFWDLEVHDDHFEIILKFGGVPQHLSVPYEAITRFVDPSVNFGFQFDMGQPISTSGSAIAPTIPSLPGQTPEASLERESEAVEDNESKPASDGTIVSLDAFRRK